MSARSFVVIVAVWVALCVPRTSLAQAICMGTGDTCDSPGTCTPSGCKNAVYCDSDDDCLKDSQCIRDRCSCDDDSDCGMIGKCFFSVTGVGSCKRPDEPAGCDEKCDSNRDCKVDAMCTFGYDDTRGLCCPRAIAEDEVSFMCGMHAPGPLDGLEPFAGAFILGLAAAIRNRSRLAAIK